MIGVGSVAHSADPVGRLSGRGLLILVALLIGGCAPVAPHTGEARTASAAVSAIPLLDVATLIQDEWTELLLGGRTAYRVAVVDGAAVIHAAGQKSASGLIRRVEVDLTTCPTIAWSWRVDVLQGSADIKEKAKEDVAASIFLLLGDPGFLLDPEPVPTLRYVWSSAATPVDVVVDNPYLPGVVRSIVVRSGEEHLGRWLTETRNVVADAERAFGQSVHAELYGIVLFTDNDQTQEPVEAYYGWARLECGQR